MMECAGRYVRGSAMLAAVWSLAAGCGGGSSTNSDLAMRGTDGGAPSDLSMKAADGGGLTCPIAGQVALGDVLADGGMFTLSVRSVAVDSNSAYADILSAQIPHDTAVTVPLNGSIGMPIITGGQLFYLASDGAFIYVIDERTGAAVLERAPVGGGALQTYMSPAQPRVFVLDGTTLVAASSTDVWAQPTGNTAATVTSFVTTGTMIQGVAAGGGFIDFIDQGSGANTGTINQISETTGGAVTPLATGQNAPVAITVAGGKVFWITIDHVVHAVSQTGGGTPMMLASNAETSSASGLTGFVSDGTNVYFGASVSNKTVVAKVSVNGGTQTVIGCNGPEPSGPNNPMAMDSTTVYWTDGGRVFKAPK